MAQLPNFQLSNCVTKLCSLIHGIQLSKRQRRTINLISRKYIVLVNGRTKLQMYHSVRSASYLQTGPYHTTVQHLIPPQKEKQKQIIYMLYPTSWCYNRPPLAQQRTTSWIPDTSGHTKDDEDSVVALSDQLRPSGSHDTAKNEHYRAYRDKIIDATLTGSHLPLRKQEGWIANIRVSVLLWGVESFCSKNEVALFLLASYSVLLLMVASIHPSWQQTTMPSAHPRKIKHRVHHI